MSKIPVKEYDQYKQAILFITKNGKKEELQKLYGLIILKYGDCDDLRMLDDLYNKKWRIL